MPGQARRPPASHRPPWQRGPGPASSDTASLSPSTWPWRRATCPPSGNGLAGEAGAVTPSSGLVSRGRGGPGASSLGLRTAARACFSVRPETPADTGRVPGSERAAGRPGRAAHGGVVWTPCHALCSHARAAAWSPPGCPATPRPRKGDAHPRQPRTPSPSREPLLSEAVLPGPPGAGGEARPGPCPPPLPACVPTTLSSFGEDGWLSAPRHTVSGSEPQSEPRHLDTETS